MKTHKTSRICYHKDCVCVDQVGQALILTVGAPATIRRHSSWVITCESNAALHKLVVTLVRARDDTVSPHRFRRLDQRDEPLDVPGANAPEGSGLPPQAIRQKKKIRW